MQDAGLERAAASWYAQEFAPGVLSRVLMQAVVGDWLSPDGWLPKAGSAGQPQYTGAVPSQLPSLWQVRLAFPL